MEFLDKVSIFRWKNNYLCICKVINIDRMKRLISVFLLSLITITAVQPTVVFHYCKGKLHSVGIVKGGLPPSCCGKCNCCSNEIIKITTDDYQIQQEVLIEAFPLLLKPVLYIITDCFLSGYQSLHSPLPPPNFPPGGLARHTVDLLTLICIFRI